MKITETQKQDILEGVVFEIVNTLKRRCPADNGHTRASIKADIGKLQSEISMSEVGKYLEYGTPPHIIEPKNAEALAFEPGKKQRLEAGKKPGKTVFAKKVQHPGTRPQPFIRPTFNDDFKKIFADNIKRVFK